MSNIPHSMLHKLNKSINNISSQEETAQVHACCSLEADYVAFLVGQLAQQVVPARQPVRHPQTTMKRGDALATPSPSLPPCMMRMPTRAMTTRSKPCSPSSRYARCLVQMCSVMALLLYWSFRVCLAGWLAAAMSIPGVVLRHCAVPSYSCCCFASLCCCFFFLASVSVCICQQHACIAVFCERKLNWTKLPELDKVASALPLNLAVTDTTQCIDLTRLCWH